MDLCAPFAPLVYLSCCFCCFSFGAQSFSVCALFGPSGPVSGETCHDVSHLPRGTSTRALPLERRLPGSLEGVRRLPTGPCQGPPRRGQGAKRIGVFALRPKIQIEPVRPSCATACRGQEAAQAHRPRGLTDSRRVASSGAAVGWAVCVLQDGAKADHRGPRGATVERRGAHRAECPAGVLPMQPEKRNKTAGGTTCGILEMMR